MCRFRSALLPALLACSLSACALLPGPPRSGPPARKTGSTWGAPRAARTPGPLGVVAAKSETPLMCNTRADLRRAGVLRFLVLSERALPREATETDESVADEIATRAGLVARFVEVGSADELVAALEQGRGEVILPLDQVRRRAGLLATLPLENGHVWGLRQDAPEILALLNDALSARALTTHKRRPAGGDLDAVLERRVLRVGLLNNSVAFHLHKGQPAGFQYELAARMAQSLGVRLEVVVPDRPAGLAALLRDEAVDLVAAPPQSEGFDGGDFLLSKPFLHADTVVVQPAGDPPLRKVSELAGGRLWARRSSSYWPVLEELAARVKGLEILAADEQLETEELVDLVGTGRMELTVSNSLLFHVERAYRDDVQAHLVVAARRPLCWAARADAKALVAAVDEFVERERRGAVAQLQRKYFQTPRRLEGADVSPGRPASRALSPYDDIAREVGRRHGLDWRLLLAQALQESRWNPKAKSWAGARGLLQVMPATAKELGLKNLEDPAEGLDAGAYYLRQQIQRFAGVPELRQRIRFGLAAYNAGYGHVQDARVLAKERGLDPDRWFGNVEQAMLLLEKPEFHRNAKYGFCRGREPVEYVSRIQATYDTYVSLVPDVARAPGDSIGAAALADFAMGARSPEGPPM